MAKINIKDLLDAGVHFGHPTKRWNPKMKPYIYGSRNGIYIFDLPKTMRKLQEACQFLYKTAAEGRDILFVATKRQAQDVVRETADALGMFHMVERWPGGTLTNNQTIRKSVARMKELQKLEESGAIDKMLKKEASRVRRELSKLQRSLSGIANMNKLPAAMFIVDVGREDIAVAEANRLKIPVVGVVDTNCNPDTIDYLIPANDDALRSIKLILEAVKASIEAGQTIYEKVAAEEAQRKAAEAAKAEKERAERAEARDAEQKAAKSKKQAPRKEAPKQDEPKAEKAAKEVKAEEPKAEKAAKEVKAEEPKAEKAAKEVKAEEPKAEDSKEEEAAAEAAE